MMPELRRLMQLLLVMVVVGGMGLGTLRADSPPHAGPKSLESNATPSVSPGTAPTGGVSPEIVQLNQELDRAEKDRKEWVQGILLPLDHNAHARAWRKFQEDVQKLRDQHTNNRPIYDYLQRIQILAGGIATIYEQGWTSDWCLMGRSLMGFIEIRENDRGREVNRLTSELTDIRKTFIP